jgi:hypothetical protein
VLITIPVRKSSTSSGSAWHRPQAGTGFEIFIQPEFKRHDEHQLTMETASFLIESELNDYQPIFMTPYILSQGWYKPFWLMPNVM